MIYSGSSAPDMNTFWKVSSVKVYHSDSGENETSWDWTIPDSNDSASDEPSTPPDSGGQGWAYDGDQVVNQAKGYVTVNGTSFIYKHDPQYQSSDGTSIVHGTNRTVTGADFIGYKARYKMRYTSNTTLTHAGLYATNPINQLIDINVAGVNYKVKITKTEPVKSYRGEPNVGIYAAPTNPDEGALSMAIVLKDLASSVTSISGVSSAEVIGNGIFIQHDSNVNLHFLGGAVNEGMTIIGQTALDVGRLPSQCKDGYVVQISNTENSDSDDYYLKFIADNGGSGTGRWEECVKPNGFNGSTVKGLDPATMPHALINNRNGTFTFKKLDEASKGSTDNYWKYREVGDDTSNPFPSFNGSEINEIFFHRNRLGFISNEQIVLSRPNDFFNLFVVSAITTSDDNPIDITVSDTKPAFINQVLQMQKGVMMFSDNAQFLLFTESDIFSPKTARLKKLSSYECDSSIQPRDLGTSVMFTSNVAAYTRAYEAVIVDDDIPPKVLEQTRVVPEYITKDITMSANSSALGIVTFGKKNSSELYHYKYFDSGERRDQSAWYSWTLTGTLEHMVYTAGSFYVVTKQGSDYMLCKHEYVTDATATRSYTVGGAEGNVGSPLYTARWFEACLDNMTIPTNIAYTDQTTTAPAKTVLTLDYTPTAATDFYAVGLNGTNAGMVVKADSVGTNTATFNDINMTGWEVAVGYKYTSTIELPNYYATAEANKYDVNGALRVSGLNFELGVSGPMEFHLTAKNSYVNSSGTSTPEFDPYIQYESGMKTGLANFGEPPSELNKSVRVPIQKKNEKYNLQIKIPDPFSTALISASWAGIYNQKRHVRR